MQEEIVKEEKIEYEDLGIGEDAPQVAAKRVHIEGYKFEKVEIDDKKTGKRTTSDKLVLVCKHPDIDSTVEIGQAKYEDRSKKLAIKGLWLYKDKDNKLPFNSGVAVMLRHMGISAIKDLKGKDIDTVANEGGYLAVKAY